MMIKKNNSSRITDIELEIYGEDLYFKEIPRMSVIEYSDDGQIIYEDYSKLDEYLDKVFIPQNIRYTVNESNDNNLEDRFIAKVKLYSIIIQNFCFLEFKHTMLYLNSKHIYVVGKLPNLGEIFDNYIFWGDKSILDNNLSNLKKFNKKENTEKIARYFSIKDNEDERTRLEKIRLKKEIIEENIMLVDKICRKFLLTNRDLQLKYEELFSIGSEALIRSLESFDCSKGLSFSLFASNIITKSMASGIFSLYFNNFEHSQWFEIYNMCRKEVEEVTNKSLYDDYTLAYVINSLMYDKYYKSAANFKNNIDRILLTTPSSLDVSDHIPSDFDIDSEFYQIKRYGVIMEVLNTLTDREKDIIKKRFGLIDGREHSLEEIGIEYNVTRERIRQIEARALRKLRHPSRSSRLREFY